MGRELMDNKFETHLYDRLSNSEVTLFFEKLENTEQLQFKSEVINLLSKGSDPDALAELQINWAEKKLTGFAKGDFTVNGKEISTDEEDKDFYPGWKGLIKEKAPGFLIALGELLYEPVNFRIKGNNRPLLKSSEQSITQSLKKVL